MFALEPDSFSRAEVNTSPVRFQETAFDWTALLAPEGVVWGVRGHNDGANLGVGLFFFSPSFPPFFSPLEMRAFCPQITVLPWLGLL